MAKPQTVGFGDWNQMVRHFHNESDRGAAIIAGSFAENALGNYLTHGIKDKKISEKLFGPVGPLSSFSQRIAVGYAFNMIDKQQFHDLEAIRQIRNHFAHHPFDTAFDAAEIRKFTSHLSMFSAADSEDKLDTNTKHRHAYLLTCGMICAQLLYKIQ